MKNNKSTKTDKPTNKIDRPTNKTERPTNKPDRPTNKPDKLTNKQDSSSLLLSPESSFSVQEAYKTLRTNVEFSLPGSDCKCIGVTSANRGEGKSTTSINLAISLAQINKKVILIDCDMRMPTVIYKLNLTANQGLSDYLSGVINDIPIMRLNNRGIDIIPSGTIPPDSTTLIKSPAMTELVEKLKEVYDYIIFDFPPINIVSDAVLISNIIDGYIIVVRHKYSEFQKIHETIRQMRFADAKIIGFVYNGIDISKKYYKRSRYYKSSYYYKKGTG